MKLMRRLGLTLALSMSILSVAWAAIAIGIYRPGSVGAEVAAIQQALVRAGFGLAVDGIYGVETETAIRQFQASRGLAVDGIAGQSTLNALGVSLGGVQPGVVGGAYVVAIPGDDPILLTSVARVVPGARFDQARQGAFINAGAFQRRSLAEAQATSLRSRGFQTARVIYRR